MSVWQQKGETLSLSNACYEYDVTEEQLRDAKLDCQYRSYFGNCVCIVKRSDVVALKRKLVQDAAEAKEKAGIEKHGAEEWARMKQEAKDKKQAKEASAKAKVERDNDKRNISNQLLTILKFSGKETIPAIDNDVKMAKTVAKREWFLNDSDLQDMESTKEGRGVKYAVQDLIAAAKKKHRTNKLEEKLEKRGESNSKGMYAAYLQHEMITQYAPDLLQEARAFTLYIVEKEVKEAETKIRDAQAEALKKQNRLAGLQAMMSAQSGLGDSTNNDNDNNNNPSPTKKAKTSS